MLLLVFRNLLRDGSRTSGTIIAIASVIAVIIVLEGFKGGLLLQLRNMVLARDADLIVAQSGVSNMIATRSVLAQSTRSEVEAVAGVKQAHPLTALPVIYESGKLRTPLFLLVYDDLGGPKDLIAGSTWKAPRDIVIDQSLAEKHQIRPGDQLLISAFVFRVSGIVKGNAALFTPLAFIRFDDLIDFFFESDLAADIGSFPLLSFLLVELDVGGVPTDSQLAIAKAIPQVEVYLPHKLAENDVALGRILFGPVLNLLIAIGYILGALVTGIILFTSVSQRRRELGVLMALGFRHSSLGAAVLIEALALVGLATPAGWFLALGLAELIEYLMPLYAVPAGAPAPALRTAVASIGFAFLGAILPLRQIRRMDPAMVFRV